MEAEYLSRELSQESGQMDKNGAKRLKSGAWAWKRGHAYAENGGFTLITGITVLSVLLSCIGVVDELDPKITATFILTAICGILWDDPLKILSHFLAVSIRRLLAGTCIMWVPAIWAGSDNYIMLMATATAAVVPLSIKANKRVMYADTWRYTASVQHGLNLSPNSEAEKAWQTWGIAECRALYGYSGNEVDAQVIGRYAKPVFFLVYHKIRDRFVDRMAENDDLRGRLYDAEDRIEILEENLKAAEQNLLEERQKDDHSGTYIAMREELEHMSKMCADLTMANDELVEALREKEVIEVSVPDDRYLYLTPEERVKELLIREKSYRDIEAITGISKTKVGRIAKELEDSYE